MLYLITGSLVFLLTLTLLLRNPLSQTVLARIATSFLSRELGAEVKINKLDIRSVRKLDLHGFLLKDQVGDTLIHVPTIKLRIRGLRHLMGDINLHTVSVEQADIRITKYEGHDISNLTKILRHFESDDTTLSEPLVKGFRLNEIYLVDSRFRFKDQNITPDSGEIIDFKHPDISGINLKANNLHISGDTLSVHILFLSFAEKSGFRVDTLHGHFSMEPTFLKADSLFVKTRKNRLDLDVKFIYNHFNQFSDFVDSVQISAFFRSSLVNLAGVRYFAPVLEEMNNDIHLSGTIRGTVSDLRARNFEFFFGQETHFKGDIQMTGLPDFQETFSHLSIEKLITTAEDVRNFRIPSPEGIIDLPELLDEFGRISINGKFTGFYNDFVSYANFNTAIGKVKTDLLLKMDAGNTIAYSGSISTWQFNAGKLFQAEQDLQRIDLAATVNGSGVSFDEMKIKMDGKINLIEFRDHPYRDIMINGELDNKKFTGMLDVNDELINLSFNGIVDYSQNIPVYVFHAKIRDAWLDRIKVISRDSSSVLSTNLSINFMGDQLDNMQGMIVLDSTKYTEDGKDFLVNNITLSITRDLNEFNIIRLYSDFLDATVEGRFSMNELPNDVNWLFAHYIDTLFTMDDSRLESSSFQDFTFSFTLKNTQALSDLFVPSLSVADGTKFSGGYNSRVDDLYFEGRSPEINYGGILIENWHSSFSIHDEIIEFITGADHAFLSDTLKADNLELILSVCNNAIDYQFSWFDLENKSFTQGNLDGQIRFLGKTRYRFNFDRADIVFGDTLWRVQPDNYILVDDKFLEFGNFSLSTVTQKIHLNGMITSDPSDTLSIGLTGFKLSNFNLLLGNRGINLDGVINGQIRIVDFFNTPFYLANLDLKGFYFNEEHFGDAMIVTSWDPIPESFDIMADFIYKGNIGERRIVGINGNYYPYRETENFDVMVEFDNFRLNAFEPFISSFSSSLEGLATGQIKLTGSTSQPELHGVIDVARGSLVVDYLNVRYFFADKIHFEKDRFYFNNMILYDPPNNQAVCSGDFRFGNFKDMELDLSLSTSNFLGLNTTRSQNSVFYGKGMISGNLSIKGPLDDLNMNVAIRSERGTSIKMPISSETIVGSSDYIVFIHPDKEEDVIDENRMYETDLSGLTLSLDLDITPEADIQIFMPYDMGELRSRGRGNLKMSILPSGDMSINGEYFIERGSFFLTIQRIINRNFDLKRGGTVLWQGDPYDARINVEAVYKVKTTLGDYAPEQDSATRVTVDCIIALRNKLLDPEIHFRIEFPDLKEDTKQYIYSRLDTSNQATMSQQMISLLVLNSFSQSTGYTGTVGFNTYSLITNQLNNWLSQISNDFDIGVNYRPGDDLSDREVEVALSTQLWDDRVLIDGNIGVRGTSNTQNTSNLVGEVIVEFKITRDGRLRARTFNKANDNMLYQNYAPYTQGVGVFYTQDFNNFGDLFIRKRKKVTITEQHDDHVSRLPE